MFVFVSITVFVFISRLYVRASQLGLGCHQYVSLTHPCAQLTQHPSSFSSSSSSSSSLGPGHPSAGWALVDRREGTVLMGKLLTLHFVPAALCSEGKQLLFHDLTSPNASHHSNRKMKIETPLVRPGAKVKRITLLHLSWILVVFLWFPKLSSGQYV